MQGCIKHLKENEFIFSNGRNNFFQILRFEVEKQQKKSMLRASLMPGNWINNLIKNHKEKQDRLTQKKIDFLTNEAYCHFLTLIINQVIETDGTDIHPDLYLAGKTFSLEAKRRAQDAVLNIINQGQNRINECYAKRRNELRAKKEHTKNI